MRIPTSHRLASCVIMSVFRAALDLDTYPLSNLIRPRCAERAKPGRGKPVLIMHNYISRTQSFQQNRHINFLALVSLKLLVSLISRLVTYSARIVVDRVGDRQTDRQIDKILYIILYPNITAIIIKERNAIIPRFSTNVYTSYISVMYDVYARP